MGSKTEDHGGLEMALIHNRPRSKIDEFHNLLRHNFEYTLFVFAKLTRFCIEYAKRSNGVSACRAEWSAGIESQATLPQDWVFGKATVPHQILHDQQFASDRNVAAN